MRAIARGGWGLRWQRSAACWWPSPSRSEDEAGSMPMERVIIRLASAAAGILVSESVILAQPTTEPVPPRDQPAQHAPGHPAEEAAPLPDYSGDWTGRQYLTGDWGGRRSEVAAAGLTFDLGWTQVAQGVVSGGRRVDWDYGGNLDAALNLDFGRMGLIHGGTLVVR